MFYPVESLKRGGRFYLCWVADSWPLRFAAVTPRQLWSHDIRTLCDDLLEVMTNESGRPSHRFSLRLSSQLMRGLVRIYERKVTVLLGDLVMINAHVLKSSNKKFGLHGIHERPLRPLPQLQAAVIVQEEPAEEQRVVEMIQNSGNVVSNIQDITLKEAVIPDFRLPANDGFGEENLDQQLQNLLGDRTIEMMLVQETSGPQISGLDLPVDKSTDRSAEKTRLQLEVPQMEQISELDATMFRKSTVGDVQATFEKEVPEIPEIPLPEVSVPTEPVPPEPQEKVQEETSETEKDKERAEPAKEGEDQEMVEPPKEPQQPKEPEEMELDELEVQPQVRKRRGRTHLIIDKKIKLNSEFLRARINNIKVELRFEDVTEAIIDVRTPAEMLLNRPASGGVRFRQNMSAILTGLFTRNLVTRPLADGIQEYQQETEAMRDKRPSQSALDKIVQLEEPQILQVEQPIVEPPTVEIPTLDGTKRVSGEALNVTEVPNVTTEAEISKEVLNVSENVNVQQDIVQAQVDIADMPTQKLIEDEASPPKRRRTTGYTSFRESQEQRQQHLVPEIIIQEIDKENIPPNAELQPLQPSPNKLQQTSSRHVSTMLEQAGLVDIIPLMVGQGDEERRKEVSEETQRKKDSSEGSSETPLGSLDRTKVSVGDSVNTTDSQKMLRQEWGIEGTMMKVMRAIKSGVGPVCVTSLVSVSALPAPRRHVAARCFTSLLKLKQHGFIRIDKNPETMEIENIHLGPRFDNL